MRAKVTDLRIHVHFKFQVHNDTLSRLEAASKSAYSYALGITVGLGGILCFLNGMLLLCLCQKRNQNQNRKNQEIDHNNSIASASGVDYLSQPQTPQIHNLHQREFSASSLPRMTSHVTQRGGQRAVIMTSGGPQGNASQQQRYRTFHSR